MTTAFLLVTLACIFALYMAWNIGANDVANSMAPSIGSGVVSLKKAIWIAAIAEFAGAILVGSSVTSTIRKGIVDPAIFAGNPEEFMLGMTAALLVLTITMFMKKFYWGEWQLIPLSTITISRSFLH